MSSLFCCSCGKQLAPSPTILHESLSQRAESTRDAFDLETAVPDAPTDAETNEIHRFFMDLHQAASGTGPLKISDLFDVRMTISVLQQQKLITEQTIDAALLERMNTTFDEHMSQPIWGIGGAEFAVRKVEFITAGEEAVVYVRFRDANGTLFKTRWWLFKTGQRWRFHDFEDLGTSLRMTTVIAVCDKAGRDGLPVSAIDRFLKTLHRLCLDDFEETEDVLQALTQPLGQELPPQFESLRLHIMAGLLADEGEYVRAIQLAHQSETLNPDIPLRNLLLAHCSNRLGQFSTAIQYADRYAAVLGQDADFHGAVGDAHAGMNNPRKALGSYLQGLADDPKSTWNILGVLQVVPPHQRDLVIPYYKALDHIDENFVLMAEELIIESDLRALRALVSLHRLLHPNDVNLDLVEKEAQRLQKRLESQNLPTAPRPAASPTREFRATGHDESPGKPAATKITAT